MSDLSFEPMTRDPRTRVAPALMTREQAQTAYACVVVLRDSVMSDTTERGERLWIALSRTLHELRPYAFPTGVSL